jgi:hypothetical protein
MKECEWMRRVTAILSVAAVVLMAAGVLAQSKPSFAGEWKIVADQQGTPGADLTITQGATTLTLEYKANGQAAAAVKLTCNLDGSVSKNTTTGRGGVPIEQASRAVWAGTNLVVTTTTATGEEKRTLSMDDGNLVVQTAAPGRRGGVPALTKVTYQKYERGFGGWLVNPLQ